MKKTMIVTVVLITIVLGVITAHKAYNAIAHYSEEKAQAVERALKGD